MGFRGWVCRVLGFWCCGFAYMSGILGLASGSAFGGWVMVGTDYFVIVWLELGSTFRLCFWGWYDMSLLLGEVAQILLFSV